MGQLSNRLIKSGLTILPVIVVILYFVGLATVFMRPLDVQQWQWADDALYLTNAQAMVENVGEEQWLGPFNKIVLSKAPFFSLFIAVSTIIGLPFRLAEFILFAPLPFFFWLAVRPLGFSKWHIILSATVCLLFVPIVGVELRLLRTSVFGSMSFYCFTGLCGLLIRFHTASGKKWTWALIAGLAMGIAATTREEAIWMLVPTSLTFLFSAYIGWPRTKVTSLLSLLIVLIVGYQAPTILFSTLNYKSYGVYAPSLRQHQDFRELYSILVSLEPGDREKYVPIKTVTRLKAYTVSPKFSELKPFLEGPALDSIALNPGHFWLNGWDEHKGREFFVSNFEFALTEAIFLSGRTTGENFLRYCREARGDLQLAVENGDIKQGMKGLSLLPPIAMSDYSDILLAWSKSIKLLLTTGGMQRDIFLELNPDPVVSSQWHSYLGTWPSLDSSKHIKMTDTVFNSYILIFFKYCYFFFMGLAILSLITLYYFNNRRCFLFFLLGGIFTVALFSFCGVIGILDTVGWPNLAWPKSYNGMGYFPLHFLLLILMMPILELTMSLADKR